MSIILKGIDLPKDSIGIELVFIPKDGDIINNESMSIGAEQIVEIPTPHGRLIDRSVLFEEYQNLCNGLLCRDCPFFNERNSCNIEEWILYQPTILEAEEQDDI